ncbi:MAG: hypothetical protein GY696_07595 [Gammaproteobacteria bacterium]|nr:hypothetical protein [Gammaproteobacteria bacterium]
MMNGDRSLEFPRPSVFGVNHLGDVGHSQDIGMQDEKLSGDWLKVVDSANQGLIIFSLGSISNTTYMPEEMMVMRQ